MAHLLESYITRIIVEPGSKTPPNRVRASASASGPSASTIVATALQKLDRGDEAAQVLARLDGMGYRHPGLIRSSAPQPAVTPSGIGPAAG